MNARYALVSDFDGTVSADDFFNLVAYRFFDEQTLAPWREYQAGRKKHFDALNEMFAQLKHLRSEDELREAVFSIPVDPAFASVAELCCRENIPLYICSAGCDYYINLLIGDLLRRYPIRLVTNQCSFSLQEGLVMSKPPLDSPYYDDNTGISKAAVVRRLKNEGYKVIYAGDGRPDLAAAREADVVFARKTLLELCREQHINTVPFPDFNAIYTYLKEVRP